jgi:uncharacterized membrane protein YecN with MAPEG domain
MNSGPMIVTPLYAALLALWFVVLSLRVVRRRRAAKVSLGDGGDALLQRTIRGQANFAEYVPLALMLMLVIELSRFSLYLVHALGIALVLARLLHGYAMAFRSEFRFGRVWGATITIVILVIEAIVCLYQAYRGHLVWFAG